MLLYIAMLTHALYIIFIFIYNSKIYFFTFLAIIYEENKKNLHFWFVSTKFSYVEYVSAILKYF